MSLSKYLLIVSVFMLLYGCRTFFSSRILEKCVLTDSRSATIPGYHNVLENSQYLVS